MADLGGGGGTEAHARSKQYDYGANSSLVLTADSRPRDAREPAGEPETLWGRVDPKFFGDRAVQSRPPQLEAKPSNSRTRKAKRGAAAAAGGPDLPRRDAKRRRRAAQDGGVLSLTDGDAAAYKPRTKETRAAYEALLSVVQQQLGGQPPDVLAGAADEVLATLKNDKIKYPDKRKDIERLLDPISNQLFDQLVSIGKLITDFHDGLSGDAVDTTLDDDVGVAVEFEESYEDEESDFDQVQDVLDEDDERMKQWI